jgi:hypothetical protein
VTEPICHDCAYPDDCLCAKRGYQEEIENCMARLAAARMRSIGIDPEPEMFEGRPPPDTE